MTYEQVDIMRASLEHSANRLLELAKPWQPYKDSDRSAMLAAHYATAALAVAFKDVQEQCFGKGKE